MLALVVAWMFGATAFVNGCTTVLVYHGGNLDEQETMSRIESDDQRNELANANEHMLVVMNEARHRYFPLSVAKMLLGAVMVGLAARAMSGRSGARSLLIQVVGAQAALMILIYYLAPDVRIAEAALRFAELKAVWLDQLRDAAQSPRYEESKQMVEQVVLPAIARGTRWGATVWLIARSVLSAFIVLALTRNRSREFFEAASGHFSER